MAMSSSKDTLRDAIERLSEEGAREILRLVMDLVQRSGKPSVLRHLAGDPAFKVPHGGLAGFRPIEPATVIGEPASSLLIADRR